MSNLDDAISLIEGKISLVVRVAERLIADNEKLRQRVDELSGLLDAKNLEVEVLESKRQSLMLTNGLAPSAEDVKNVKQQLNRMVREIDKCIALLNK